MIFSFYLAKHLLLSVPINSAFSFLRVFININALMHLIDTINWRMFGNERVFDLAYGFFEIPSPFSLALGCYAIIILLGKYNVSRVEKIILISAILFSESRIGTGAFFITMIIVSRYRIRFFLLAMLLYVSLLFTDVYFKSLSFLTLTFDKITQDPSLLMRLDNMNAMIDWWDTSGTMLFGGGVLSHLEYSIQFGKEGPLDSLFLKMLSDFGLVSFILFLILIILLLIKNFNIIKLNFNEIIAPLMFVFIYSIVNEGLVSVKSGHIVFFLIGIVFWGLKMSNSRQVINQPNQKTNKLLNILP
jgi:hypothetical protein